MTMQTDVKAKKVTATGAATIGLPRIRIKGIYYVSGATAGSVAINDGSAAGPLALSIDTPALATWTDTIMFPGEGILCQGDPYVTLTNAVSVTLFYG
jgi:hypothetical protein